MYICFWHILTIPIYCPTKFLLNPALKPIRMLLTHIYKLKHLYMLFILWKNLYHIFSEVAPGSVGRGRTQWCCTINLGLKGKRQVLTFGFAASCVEVTSLICHFVSSSVEAWIRIRMAKQDFVLHTNFDSTNLSKLVTGMIIQFWKNEWSISSVCHGWKTL
jgi:hypothetical protein